MSNSLCTSSGSLKPKVSDLRKRFEFIKASFAVEDIHFTKDEESIFERSIARRHRGPGLDAASTKILRNAGIK